MKAQEENNKKAGNEKENNALLRWERKTEKGVTEGRKIWSEEEDIGEKQHDEESDNKKEGRKKEAKSRRKSYIKRGVGEETEKKKEGEKEVKLHQKRNWRRKTG